jgi:hypothetical protein
MGDDPMALLGLEGALKHYYFYLINSYTITTKQVDRCVDPQTHSAVHAHALLCIAPTIPESNTACIRWTQTNTA